MRSNLMESLLLLKEWFTVAGIVTETDSGYSVLSLSAVRPMRCRW